MFKTYRCLDCTKHFFPPRAVCPYCHSLSHETKPDPFGTVINYTIDQRTQRILSVVLTQNKVLVMSESLHVIPVGQTAYLTQANNKIISNKFSETTHEENAEHTTR